MSSKHYLAEPEGGVDAGQAFGAAFDLDERGYRKRRLEGEREREQKKGTEGRGRQGTKRYRMEKGCHSKGQSMQRTLGVDEGGLVHADERFELILGAVLEGIRHALQTTQAQGNVVRALMSGEGYKEGIKIKSHEGSVEEKGR
jgi:hypothetical protein